MRRVAPAKTRFFDLLAATVWLALVASPAVADGLARFEKSIKPQIPPGALTYKSARALGDNGFELQDAVVTPPPSDPAAKPQPIAIKTITVEDLDFAAIEKQQTPLFAKLRFDGITTGSNLGGMFDLKQLAGRDTLNADFQLDYKIAPDQKTFTLTRMVLNLAGLGRLETSMIVDGISPDSVASPDTAKDDAALRTANIVYDDHSLLAVAIPIAAAMQGTDPKSLIALATALLDSARTGQGEAARKAIDSLVAFIEDYQKPKGPLRIVLNPPDKVTQAQLNDAKSADEMVKLLGVEVSYAGTRTSTPAEIPATTDTPADKDAPVEQKKE